MAHGNISKTPNSRVGIAVARAKFFHMVAFEASYGRDSECMGNDSVLKLSNQLCHAVHRPRYFKNPFVLRRFGQTLLWHH